MAELSDYASPILRKAVHDQIYPGSWVEYEVLPVAESTFGASHRSGEDGLTAPTHVVRCTIIRADGTFLTADREIDRQAFAKRNGATVKVEVPQTPEELVKIETKALGRAMTKAGIPQRMSELQSLMRWWAALANTTAYTARPQGPSDVEVPMAPAPTPAPPREPLMDRLRDLPDATRAAVTAAARNEMDIANIANQRDPDVVAALHALIDRITTDKEGPT